MTPAVATVPRRAVAAAHERSRTLAARGAAHYLEFSSTAWLASSASVGGGDELALALLPALGTHSGATRIIDALDAEIERAEQITRAQPGTWAIAEACAALREEHLAQRNAAIAEGQRRAAEQRRVADAHEGALRRTMSNELLALLHREVADLKNALRSMLVNDAVASAAGATDAQVRAALVKRCGELFRLLCEQAPANVSAVWGFVYNLEPGALRGGGGGGGTPFAIEFDAFSSQVKLADLYLHLHAALGAHATARDALLAALGATPPAAPPRTAE